MDREQLRAWLNALSAGDFSDLMTRVSLSSELTAFALAFGLPRADQTDSLLNFYAHSPREALAFLDMSVLNRLAELRDRPQPLRLKGLSPADRAALELLRRLGLAHRGRSGWLVADLVWPLCDLTDEERAEVSRRDSLMELLRGTLLLTGMLPLSTVRSFVGLPDTRHGESELTHAYVQRSGSARFAMTPRGVWLASEYLADPVAFWHQVTRPELAETPRVPFTMAQALQAHRTTLPVLFPDALPILKAVGESGGDAGIAGRQLLFLAQNLPAAEAGEMFLDGNPELRDTALARQLPELLRSLPLWRHLGHAEKDIARYSLPRRRLN